jgi:predicted flap endonuclease-1-like 5' DNA nuclease
MVALFVQTLLLTAAAYFVGAAVACLVRRTFQGAARPEAVPARPVEPLPDAAQRTAVPARFGRNAEAEARPAQQAVPAPSLPPDPIVLPPARVAVPAPAQDLKYIRLIDAELEARLNKSGIRRYEEIAAWMQADVRRMSESLGLGDRISRENWIEQAQVLAKGGATHYATRAARGELANAAPTPDEGEPRALARVVAVASAPLVSTGGASGVAAQIAMAAPAPALPLIRPAAPESAPDVSGRAAFAATRREEAAPASLVAPVPMPEPAVPLRPAAPATRDNLKRISGVDAEVEKLLTAQGINRYSQIAHWSPADVTRFDGQMGAPGRIGRENWIEQAQILGRGGDTAFSRDYDRRARGESGAAPLRATNLSVAIRANSDTTGGETPQLGRTDFASLRSVRSAAYQSAGQAPDTASRVGTHSKVLRSAALEDLKRIRGIGVLIEKKLNQMGVVAYEQIANWTAQDIDRVSQSLDFKGRIERENWVEQARILASGGATEFSRRVDRGEVETSRYRQ